jgi:anti-sigma regulatory factor (Ser/Thr protein kinase)
MGRTLTINGPEDVQLARQFVVERCYEIGHDEACDDAAVLASEIVTNAVLHGSGPVYVEVESEDNRLHVAVTDTASALPVLRDRDDLWTEGGLGLHIVEAYATQWGVIPHIGGKTVWFRI